MATYVQLQRTAQGEAPGAYEQVRWACTEAAVDVEQEDPGTPNHQARLSWATKWRSGYIRTSMEQYVSITLENPTIAAAVGGTETAPTWGATDSDTQFQINSVLDRLAALP